MNTQMFLKVGAAALLAITAAGCDVDVADKGKLPKVNVDVEPGRVPDVDVHGPDIDVKMKDKTVKVPDVDVKTKDVNVKVPDVDVRIPRENDNEPAPAGETEKAPQ